MINPFLIIIGTFLIVVVFVGYLITIFFKATRRRLDQRILAELDDSQKILDSRNTDFIGLASGQNAEIHGSGALVLAENRLIFFQILPPHNMTIPIAAIVDVSSSKTYLNKRYPRPVFRVTFTTHQGQDEAAWVLSDPETWISAINDICQPLE